MDLNLDNTLKTVGLVSIANYAGMVQCGHALRGRNLRTVEGNEILARTVGGDMRYRLSAIYFHFTNGVPSVPSFDKTTSAADFHALSTPEDYVRASLVAAPVIQTGDSLASGDNLSDNRSVLFAIAVADVGEGGLPFTAADSSQILSVGLVATPEPSDPSQDILYARYALPTAFPKVAGQNPGVSWTVEFQSP